MKAFVTGGSGFIGRHLIPKLIKRGYTVYALARSTSSQAIVSSLGATPVPGDITDPESMREGMKGCQLVFHLAAWYEVGGDASQAQTINVEGTRHVLNLAYELHIPKIVYVSTIAVWGDTQKQLVDESHESNGPFITEYERTKWLAHHQVAEPLMAQGAPLVIVMPGGVYGPGDTSLIGDLMRRFYLNMPPYPFLPGPETTFTYAHVDDVAEGIILAAEKGKVGEKYILAGPAVPLNEIVDFWSRLTGKRTPLIYVPSRVLRPLAPLVKLVEPYLQLPALFSSEAIAGLGISYTASANKARQQLGWKTRSLQAGMLETFGHIAAEADSRPVVTETAEQQWGKLALVAAGVLFVLWFMRRKWGKK